MPKIGGLDRRSKSGQGRWAVLDGLKFDRPVILFVGAGISAIPPTSAPLWSEIAGDTIASLLETLATGREDWGLDQYRQPAIALARYPELLFEQIRIAAGTNQLMSRLAKILSGGKPNICHISIADLCRQGLVRAIVTTNFDCYLEQSLLALQVPYRKLVPPVQAQHSSKELLLVKIHGDLDTPESIVLTLSRAAQPMAAELARLLRDLMSGQDLVILGYSGRDLDVFPILVDSARKIVANRGRVWINDLYPPEQWGPIKQLYEEGVAMPVIADASLVLSELAGRKTPSMETRLPPNASLLDDMPAGDIALVLASLFLEAGEVELACQMYHVGEDIASSAKDNSRKSAALAGQALCWLKHERSKGRQDLRTARHFANWSHEVSCRIDRDDLQERDFLWISRAAICRAEADYPDDLRKGLQYLDFPIVGQGSSWPWFDLVQAERHAVRASILERIGDSDNAITQCEQSIEFAISKGLVASEIRAREILARVLESNGEASQANVQRERIRHLAELCGIAARISGPVGTV